MAEDQLEIWALLRSLFLMIVLNCNLVPVEILHDVY